MPTLGSPRAFIPALAAQPSASPVHLHSVAEFCCLFWNIIKREQTRVVLHSSLPAQNYTLL